MCLIQLVTNTKQPQLLAFANKSHLAKTVSGMGCRNTTASTGEALKGFTFGMAVNVTSSGYPASSFPTSEITIKKSGVQKPKKSAARISIGGVTVNVTSE